jgi:putative hemolysin
MILELLIIIGLILLNGIFSLSEIAIVSSRKARLEMLKKKGHRGAQVALDLAHEPTRFLSTVQIGITLIGILTGLFSGAQIASELGKWIATFPLLSSYSTILSTGIVVLIVTYFTLIFGELIPKKIGLSNPEKISSVMAVPMSIISSISKPFVSLLSSSTHLIFRLLNIKADDQGVTEEEILALVEEGTNTGSVEEIEQDILENIFHLGDKNLESIMTHISDVVMLDVNATREDVLEVFRKYRYSIYPVYQKDRENVIGIISIKDILAQLDDHVFTVAAMVKPIHFFPEYTKSYKVLETFMESKTHHGLIVDEFGTLLGLVTMNDLLHDLVGNISQEDSISYEFTQREDGSWLVDGMFPFVDFLKEFDLEFEIPEDGDFNTMAGFMIFNLKKLPTTGDHFEWKNYRFEVVDMDNRRIDKILISTVIEPQSL